MIHANFFLLICICVHILKSRLGILNGEMRACETCMALSLKCDAAVMVMQAVQNFALDDAIGGYAS